MRLVDNLAGIPRCPHCGVANPQFMRLWISEGRVPRSTPGPTNYWAIFSCTSCGDCVSAQGGPNQDSAKANVTAIFPEPKKAHKDIPEMARRYLQQAYETLHAPDAAALMAGSAVDAMLKEYDYEEGSLYTRIDKAVNDHLLTDAMGKWAHEVRLESNRPRHADAENPHVSTDEAKQSVEFAEALAYFLFVLKAQIDRGIELATQEATEDAT